MKTRNLAIYSGVLILSGLLFLISCDEMITGSGNLIKETRIVKSFDAIDASGAFHIYLSQGDE